LNLSYYEGSKEIRPVLIRGMFAIIHFVISGISVSCLNTYRLQHTKHTHTHARTHAHTRARAHTHTHTHTCTHAHTRSRAHTHTHTHTHMHARMHTHALAHTPTHTRASARATTITLVLCIPKTWFLLCRNDQFEGHITEVGNFNIHSCEHLRSHNLRASEDRALRTVLLGLRRMI